MFSLFNKKREEISIIFDIGSGSVGAALVKFPKAAHEPPVVLYSYREPLTFMPRLSSKRFLAVMLKLLENVARHIQRDGLSHLRMSFFTPTIKRMICIFSSPWYASQTKVIKIEKEQPFLIDQAFLTELTRREDEQFKSELAGGSYEKTFGADVRVLEKKIIDTHLNGYQILDPINKKARELEVTFLSSFISNAILEEVERTLHKVFHFRKIRYYSYALASWSAIRNLFPSEEDFLFMDISDEVTDITLTSKGVLMETVSMPLGRSMFIRRVVDELAVTPEIAVSFLTMHAAKSIEERFASKIASIVQEAQQDWMEKLIEILGDLEMKYPLSSHLFTTVDNDFSGYFLDALRQLMPPELNIPERHFNVVFLGSETLKFHVSFAPRASRDSFLALESVFIRNVIT